MHKNEKTQRHKRGDKPTKTTRIENRPFAPVITFATSVIPQKKNRIKQGHGFDGISYVRNRNGALKKKNK